MATIRKRAKRGGHVYNVQVRIQGFPPRSETFNTRRAAERWARQIEGEMAESKHTRSAEALRRTLGDAVDRYLREVAPYKRSPDKSSLRWWKAELGHLKLAEVTPALVVQRRDKLAAGTYTKAKPASKRSTVKPGEAKQYRRTPAAVNRYLACLSRLFNVARKQWQWCSYNPVEDVSKLPESKGRIRALTDAERKALFAETAQDETLHLFVLIALTTACRAGELQNLTWADVDLKSGRLLFRITKNAEPRTAWVHGEALKRLKAHTKVRQLKGGPVFVNASGRGERYQYSKLFRDAVDRAGIQNVRFHDLRHTAATYLARMGATEQQLRAIGGWRSGVVSRYVHLAAEDSRAVLKDLAGKVEE